MIWIAFALMAAAGASLPFAINAFFYRNDHQLTEASPSVWRSAIITVVLAVLAIFAGTLS